MVSPRCSLFGAAVVFAATLTAARAPNWYSQFTRNPPQGRWAPQMTYDAAHSESVLFGGVSANNLGPSSDGDTWVWQGIRWIQLTPTTSPHAREGGALVYDGSKLNAVLFGGSYFVDNGITFTLGDTWTWDGSNWTQQTPANSPSARYGFGMTYDAMHGLVVLFGGSDGTNFLNDTWIWDGTNWTQKFPLTTPSPRFEPAFSYDNGHGQVVMMGGVGANGIVDETWVWDGSNWTQLAPATTPGPRYGSALVYDLAEKQTILFGGDNSVGTLSDTWAWDGTTWTSLAPNTVPPPRFYPGADYDSSRGVIVMFAGGYGSPKGDVFQDDTWEWH